MHPTDVRALMDLWDTDLKQMVLVSSVSDESVCAKPRNGAVRLYRGADLDRLRRPTRAEANR